MKKIHQILLFLIVTIGVTSCKKYLDAKSDKKLAIVSSIEDVQAIMDTYQTISVAYPTAIELCSDNYYVSDVNITLATNESFESDMYLWKKNEGDANANAWITAYRVITNSNIALEELGKLKVSSNDMQRFNETKGNVLFIRGYYFYILSQLYGQPYMQSTSSVDLGIPIRLSSDVLNEKSERKSVNDCYLQILSDLKSSVDLLPVTALIKTRGCKPAAYGAIAKTYLAMQQYDSVSKYADLSLKMYDSLMDYNDLDTNQISPFLIFNKEVTFHLVSGAATLLQPTYCLVDTLLFGSYSESDLRRPLYYISNGDNTYSFKGGYEGYYYGMTRIFGGIATDEILLIRAEAFARLGKLTEALDDLNLLLSNRIKKIDFEPFYSSAKDEIIDKILDERRKELVFRGARWTDLRRLRLENGRSVIPKRKVNGQIFELSPSSPRYTSAIPAVAINLSGMPQNP